MTQKFFYGRPLVLLAIGLIAGILAGRYILGLWAYCFSSAAALLSILLWKLRVPYAPLVFVAAAIGVLRITVAYPVLPAPAYNGVVSGRICETPVQTAYSWNLTLDHAAYDGNPLDGRVLLRVYADELECGYGQVVAAGATLSLPTGARNEGGMDARFYYLSKNIVCTASTNGETLVLHDGSLDFYGRLQQLRNASTRVLVELMGERNGTLAAGMLHGDVQDIPDDILDDFRASGITHLLSVSGLHVSLLTGVLLFLLKRVKPVPRLIVVAAFLTFYCMFTALSAATVRASIMALCMLSGAALGRRNDQLSSLSLACILILLITPFELFSVGFQLSFTAMLGMFLLSPTTTRLLKKLPKPAAEMLGVSFSAQMGTLPSTTTYFNRVPLLSILANMLVVPLGMLVMLPSILALFAYFLSPLIASYIASIADTVLHLMRAVATAAASAGALSFSSPSLGCSLFFFAALLFQSDFCLAPKKAKRVLCVLASSLCVLLWLLPGWLPKAPLTVLEVPRGYAAHVHMSGGDVLIGDEAGLQSSAVSSYLLYNGIVPDETITAPNSAYTLTINEQRVTFGYGFLAVDGNTYFTADYGQMRLRYRNGSPVISAYASDARYDILIQ